jgi:hypothetical protein
LMRMRCSILGTEEIKHMLMVPSCDIMVCLRNECESAITMRWKRGSLAFPYQHLH